MAATKQPSHAPAPSEQTLFSLWDVIDRARQTQGERKAAELARKALEAIRQEGDTE